MSVRQKAEPITGSIPRYGQRGHVACDEEGRQMSAGALLISVNPRYFARMRNTGDANRSAVHCNIWAGALVNNKGKYKRARHTLSPYFVQLTEFARLFPLLRCMQASLRPGGTRRSRPARQPNGVPAIVDACRSLQ